MPRTTKQVLAEQAQQAERERTSRPPQPPATRQAAPPATPDTRSPRECYLDDIAPSGIVGRLIRFNGKDGRYMYVDTDETIGDAEDFIVLADQTLASYVKFQGDQPPIRVGGLLYAPDFALPPREQLGDNDPAHWEIGLSGKAEDPWKHELMMVLKRPATQELLTFSTMSKTGRRAVGDLLRHYDRLQRHSPGSFPVVRLKPGGYKDDRIGWVHTPTFVNVGISPGHTADIPDTSLKGQLNDKIPF